MENKEALGVEIIKLNSENQEVHLRWYFAVMAK